MHAVLLKLTLIFTALLIFNAKPLLAEPSNKSIEYRNVSGLWTDVNTKDFKHGYLIIAQDNNDIHITHYLEYKGQPMVEFGRGSRSDNQLDYQVKVTRKIPGWVTKGQHQLTLSADGQTLTGRYVSKAGSGPLKFVRFVK